MTGAGICRWINCSNYACKAAAMIEGGTTFYERVTGKISVEMLRPSWIIFSGGSQTQPHLVARAPRAQISPLPWSGRALVSLALLTALAIKLESPGPDFYKAGSVGKMARASRSSNSARCARTRARRPAVRRRSDDRTTRIGASFAKCGLMRFAVHQHPARRNESVGPRPERPSLSSN